MKRLLCLLSGMDAGGAETFLMKIYRALDKTQFQMDFCINVEGSCFYTSEIEKLGGRIYHIPSKSQSLTAFRKQLFSIIKEHRYRYVLRITSNAMGFMDLKIAKKAGAEICVARSSNSSDGGGFKSKISHLLGRLLYSRYVDVRIAPSDLAAKYTFGKKAYQRGDVLLLRNALDLNLFRFDEAGRNRIRAEFGLDETAWIMGHVGRFSEQKNHRFLLEVFKEAKKLHENAVLMLVGHGELETQIKEQAETLGISDRIIFTGVRADVVPLLSAMDVFVFPSFYEGMPNTVIEAQTTGLPCVISDTITGEADISGNVSFVSLSDTAETWAKQALNVAASGEKKIERQAVCLSDSEYDIKKTVDRFVNAVFTDR